MGDENFNTAQQILEAVGMPFEEMQNDDKCGASWARRTPGVMLTFAGIGPDNSVKDARSWSDGADNLLKNKQWIERYNGYWGHVGGNVGSGTYDYFFRCPIRYLNELGVIAINPDKPRPQTSPARVYGLTEEARDLIRNWSDDEDAAVKAFLEASENIRAEWIKQQQARQVVAQLDRGRTIALAGDSHDVLQKMIVEEFAPRFIENFEVLYIADTSNKQIRATNEKITRLGLEGLFEKDLPDVVIWDEVRQWVFIIEAIHSSGVITPSRLDRFKTALGEMSSRAIFVSVFANRDVYKRFVDSISWKTEVWIADNPDNMIHHDGERFLGPYT
jgi:hypothetical protein